MIIYGAGGHAHVVIDILEAIGNCETRKKVAETIKVGDYPIIVHPTAIVSKFATIGEGSIVTKDIPDNVTAYGNPCRVRHFNV